MTFELLSGDCRDALALIDTESVDAVVCDPPYDLQFMNKDWDNTGVAFDPATWVAVKRVMKPGAHLLAFGGTRTFHRLACAVEDAGFELRDCLSWLYGTGMPKGLNISKALDKQAGAVREPTGFTRSGARTTQTILEQRQGCMYIPNDGHVEFRNPASDLAKQWDGWSTAMKPAWEPVFLARKPLIGTVAQNITAFGVGGINVDACRIETTDTLSFGSREIGIHGIYQPIAKDRQTPGYQNARGRWPANVVLDETVAKMLGESARYFYTPKASRRERELGLSIPAKPREQRYGSVQDARPHTIEGYEYPDKPIRNPHPTVKPVALMRWLVKLITPPNGLILDPFCGSGSTGVAAMLEGFCFLGIDLSPEYIEIARQRIAYHLEQEAA